MSFPQSVAIKARDFLDYSFLCYNGVLQFCVSCSLRSWRYCRPKGKKILAKKKLAAKLREEPLPVLFKALPVAFRLRRQNFISRALTIPPVTQAASLVGGTCGPGPENPNEVVHFC